MGFELDKVYELKLTFTFAISLIIKCKRLSHNGHLYRPEMSIATETIQKCENSNLNLMFEGAAHWESMNIIDQ